MGRLPASGDPSKRIARACAGVKAGSIVTRRQPRNAAWSRQRNKPHKEKTHVDPGWLLALAGGVCIAAACGLRAFLPLLFLGAAARLGAIHLRPGAAWLADDLALAALGVATVLEIAADKIPVVDHAIDAVGTVIRPAAAWLGAFAVLAHWPTPWGQIVAFVLAGASLGIHVSKAKLRLGSSAVTLGHANPALSIGEDALAFGLCWAVFLPVAALVAIVLAWWLLVRWRAARRA
jgi:hypothetical protein